MHSDNAEFVIQGKTVDGKVFEPADWAERLCASVSGHGNGMLSRVGADGHKIYSFYVRMVVSEGIKCVVVRIAMQKTEPEVFERIKRYVADNRLMVRAGRGSRDSETAVESRSYSGRERRDPKRNIW